MRSYQKFPFIRIFAGIILGILIEHTCSVGIWPWLICSIACFASLVIHPILQERKKWQYRIVPGLCIFLLLISLGGWVTYQSKKKKEPSPLPEKTEWVYFEIIDGPSKSKKGIRYTARIHDMNQQLIRRSDRAFIYINGVDTGTFEPGDFLLAFNKLKSIKPSSDPLAFDFYTYASRKHIHFTYHCQNQELVKLIRARSYLDELTLKLSYFFLKTLRKNIPDKKLCGLAEAMLTGYREELDQDILKAYTDTGVVHIIAISGLHLGLIFWLADFFLRKLVSRKFVPITGLLIILPMLWIFALMTGSSASIMRSVVMFTFSICGNALDKKNNSMNGLLASATFLLLRDPFLIYDIGFQLSYAAVASILIFEQPIRSLVYLKNKLAVYCWSMVSITLAAQVLTTPFVVFHFHRFPILFLFSNLVAVPISSIILILEIALCCLEPIKFGTNAFAYSITMLMTFMNNYVYTMQHIPFNLIKDIYLDPLVLFTAVTSTFVLSSYICKPDKQLFFTFLTLVLLTSIFRIHGISNQKKSRSWIILQSWENTYVIHKHGRAATIFVKNNTKDIAAISKGLKPTLDLLAIESITWKKLPASPFLLQIPFQEENSLNQAHLIAGPAGLNLKDISSNFHPRSLIIADGSNKLWKIRQWEKESQELNLRFLSTSLIGSVTIKCQH